MMINGTRRASALLLISVALCLAVPSSALGISRAFVISRAKAWVAAEVPYSSSRYATVAGKLVPKDADYLSRLGYRTDCSGFVSMCLNLRTKAGRPYSLSTATLDNSLVRIKKRNLLPGDVILRPKDLVIDGEKVAYGHAVIFGGWTDDTHKYYYGYHESSSADRAVKSKIRWGDSGFWDEEGFRAYRYPAVRDRVKAPAADVR